METGYANKTHSTSAAPGPISKQCQAAWVCCAPMPTPTVDYPSPAHVSTGLVRQQHPSLGAGSGLGRSVQSLFSLTVQSSSQPTRLNEDERRARGACWSCEENEMIFLADMPEWEYFSVCCRMRVPSADRQ